MNIRKFCIDELLDWIKTDEFNMLQNHPISQHRALSYAANPRINKDDIILYAAFDNEELVGYRTLLPDWAFVNGDKFKFAWLSGSWVHPLRRRQGISTILLNEAFVDWDFKLAFTNYAPAGKAINIKTGQFDCIFKHEGIRFYFRIPLAGLLVNKNLIFSQLGLVFKIIDRVGNTFLLPWHAFFKWKTKASVIGTYTIIDNLFPELEKFINHHTGKSLTCRKKTELEWVKNFPWVFQSAEPGGKGKYYFSDFSSKVKNINLAFYDYNGHINGFMMLNCYHNKMAIPYAFFADNFENKKINETILYFALLWEISYLTVYNPIIKNQLKALQGFVFKKKIEQCYFFTNKLIQIIGLSEFKFYDGDGDCVFT